MRLKNIDILRGIVMILMCIDHARDYTLYHPADPMDLAATPFVVYLFRILAHFCAPTFILLAGISARLSGRKKSPKELSMYLLSRGLILCFLEFTLVNWGWSFNPLYKMTYLQVIWALGISMIALSAIIHLKEKYIILLSVIILAGHNLFDSVHFEEGSPLFYIWSLLEQKNVLPITQYWSVRTTYPVLPVIGLMALGYVFGRLYTEFTAEKRTLLLKIAGLSMFTLFLILRIAVDYGDPHSMEWSSSFGTTLLSLFNVTKYPLSLQFILMTLTGTCLFLAYTESISIKNNNFVLLLGQVPMFFYIIHIYVLHAIALIIVLLQGGKPSLINDLGGIPSDFGEPLWWLLWIVPLTIVILLPLCKKYHALKLTRKYKLTSYL